MKELGKQSEKVFEMAGQLPQYNDKLYRYSVLLLGHFFYTRLVSTHILFLVEISIKFELKGE